MVQTVHVAELQLPWSPSIFDDGRFQRILAAFLCVLILLGIAVPLLSVPSVEREKLEKLPPQLAKLVLKKKKPPPAKVAKRAKPQEIKKEVAKAPVEKPKPMVAKKPPKAEALVKRARKKAMTSGLLAMRDDLAAMRQQPIKKMNNNTRLGKTVAKAKKLERSLIASKAVASSGGIARQKLSRGVMGGHGDVQMAGRKSLQIAQPDFAVADVGAGDSEGLGSGRHSGLRQRSEEEIRAVIDQNKGALYAIYNRVLRKDPGLQGKITVQIVVEASGEVSEVKVVSSELDNGKMERKLVARIRMINFESDDVAKSVVNYTFDFLPYMG